MPRRPRAMLPDIERIPPTIQELLDTLDAMEMILRPLAARWHNHLSGQDRADIHRALAPATVLLIRANRRR